MFPSQAYQLYQIERPKTAAEIRAADERAGRTAAAIDGVLRRFKRSRPDGGIGHQVAVPCGYGTMTRTAGVR